VDKRVYSDEQVLKAALETFDFFEKNPEKRISGTLALRAPREDDDEYSTRAVSPWDPEADCFCFMGKFARELGQLPEEMRESLSAGEVEAMSYYEPGYAETVFALGENADTRIYSINDNPELTDEEVLQRERLLFRSRGVNI
jgi:hypothetical protein